MKYISTGIVQKNSTEEILNISHCSGLFQLTGLQAALWLNGRTGFVETDHAADCKELKHLAAMGLVILAEETQTGEFFALTHAVLICTEKRKSILSLTKDEKLVLTWLREAGLHLSVAELVYLIDHKIGPDGCLLGEENRQALVQRIYTEDTIFDNLLEFQMAHASCRDQTVRTLMSLLKKGYLILI